MPRCQNAPIARITRPNASLRKWRRSELNPKGKLLRSAVEKSVLNTDQCKIHRGSREPAWTYGVVAQALRASERGGRRQNRFRNTGKEAGRSDKEEQQSRAATLARPSSESQHTTPRIGNSSSPKSAVNSPEYASDSNKAKEKGNEEEVEALSDMMCSLVTNNCGETRYIGKVNSKVGCRWELTAFRLFIRLFNLLPQGYSVGERKDWGQLIPGDDLFSGRGRQQVGLLEA